MKRILIVAALLLLPLQALASAGAVQDAERKKPSGPIGDLVAIDAEKGLLTIKTKTGEEAKASVTPTTEYLMIEPGKTTLEGAEPIQRWDLKVGDRVWARGVSTQSNGTVEARQVIVMSAEALAERRRADATNWQRRGVIGDVTAVDPATREITVRTYRNDTVTIAVTGGTDIRSMKPGATDLSESAPLTFEEISVGDQVAARGDRNEDRTRLTAEVVLAGRFARPIRGRVTSIDTASRTLVLEAMGGTTSTITLSDTAMVRKFTPRMPPQGQDGAGGANAQGADAPRAEGQRPEAAQGGEAAGPRGRRGGGFAFGMGNREELERRTEALDLAEIAPGDIVFAIVDPSAPQGSALVNVLVKVELPPGFTPQQRQGQGIPPAMNPGGMSGDDEPF